MQVQSLKLQMILDHYGAGRGRRVIEYLQCQKLRRTSNVGMIPLDREGMGQLGRIIRNGWKICLSYRLKEIKTKLVGVQESQTGEGGQG